MASRVPLCNSRLWKIAKFQKKNFHELACIYPVHEIEFEKIRNDFTMNKNTINERKKTNTGTGVQMSKYFNHNSPASQGNK